MLQQTSPARTARPRRYLMCRPTHFAVDYSINPWMDPCKPVDTELAIAQWERLRDLYLELGHTVDLIEPVPGLPDMVFSANGATVVDGKALVARFRHEERAAEAAAYVGWFRERGYSDVHRAEFTNEGEGDYLVVGDRILAGTGFRTDRRAHSEAEAILGRPVVTLELVDPNFYHLDTALSVLNDTEVMYYPAAFSPESLTILQELYPDAILATEDDAQVFGLNAVSDGRRVVLPEAATHLISALRERGFEPIGVDITELLKAGGSVKCCTLELRGAPLGDEQERINYNGRRFRSTHSGPGGEAPEALYIQEGDLVRAEFAGRDVRHGSLAGRVIDFQGTLDFAYCMVLDGGEVISGRSLSTPEVLEDGRIRLREEWERYGAHADSGVSYIEEVRNV